MKQYFKQIIRYPKLLTAGFLCCGIFSQLCLPSEAAFRSKVKGQRLKVKDQSLEITSSFSPSPPLPLSNPGSTNYSRRTLRRKAN